MPEQFTGRDFGFSDPRLPELLFRYRARNWPQTLDAAEQARWNDYRRQRLLRDSGLSELTLDGFRAELVALRAAHAADPGKLVLLDQLDAWGHDIDASLR